MKYNGLTPEEVEQSRRKNGSNVLTPPEPTPWWKLLGEKFRDPLIIILLVAGILSIGIAIYEHHLGEGSEVFFEPVGIFMAILLATVLAFMFEQKANKAFKILNKVNDDEPVEVIRATHAMTIPRREVVVGDIAILNTGDEIPADGTLLEAVTLSIDESSLTGEPLCTKTTDSRHFDPEATYGSNRVLRGTKIMEGHGLMRVDRVGDATEMGKVFVEAQIDSSVKTPLNEQLARLAKLITRASYLIAALIIIAQTVLYFSANDFLNGETDWPHLLTHMLKTLMVAVTLIVVAVPEGLPMAVTLSLAYSMSRMLKTNNLVRKMHACETMGAATVICTDKTGTLTQNRMQVSEMVFFGNPPRNIIHEGIALNSTARLDCSGVTPKALGNPTEAALLFWLSAQGVDYETIRNSAQIIEETPFTTERKFMSTLVETPDGKRRLYIKGAPEIVFAMCESTPGTTPREVDAKLAQYQNRAMRTLGFACREDNGPTTFLGIAAISDPVRQDVPHAVREVMDAGIKVKIVTGDTPATAKEIGRQIGLWNDEIDTPQNVITGEEFGALSDSELRTRVESIKIIARARPLDKKRLVEALQANGEVVAVTGDGTNDAPALKSAHVGLSMGDGTSVAKEASDITIIDNSFASIGRAVMWGRSLYKNIQRFLLFQLTVNVAACLLVLCGSFMGTESPLTVTQMLWVNLIMDTFGAMALASLPPSPSVMKEKPRPRSASILTRAMSTEIFGVGIIFFAITLAFYWLFNHAEITSLPQILHARFTSPHPMTAYEATLLFSIFVWTHFWYMFNARSFETGKSLFSLKLSSGFRSIVAIIILGQLFITEIAYEFFNVEPLLHTTAWHFNPTGAKDLLTIIILSSLVLWIRELHHLLKISPHPPKA